MAAGALLPTPREAAAYVLVGGTSFLLYTAIYLPMRLLLPAVVANTVAFIIASWTNTIWHRRYTFQLPRTNSENREQLENFATLLLGLLITNGSLLLLEAQTTPGKVLEYTTLIGANAAAGIVHYLLLKIWVFSPERSRGQLR